MLQNYTKTTKWNNKWSGLHWTASCILKLWGVTCVLCSTTQLMSLPLSAAVGTIRYSLMMVTVLSAPALDSTVALPLAVVTQTILAAGRPSADSQRATTTGLELSTAVTTEARFWGLAGGEEWKDGWMKGGGVGEDSVAVGKLEDAKIDQMEIGGQR